MAIQYSIDRARRMVFTTWSGQVTYEELSAYLEQLRNDPNFDPNLDQLVDLSNVSVIKLTFDTLNSIRQVDPFSAESKRAVVAPKDVAYGLSRMYEALKGGGFTVFRAMEPARAWLGLESVQGAQTPDKGD